MQGNRVRRAVPRPSPGGGGSRDVPDATLGPRSEHGGMENTPTTSKMPASLIFSAGPPIAVAFAWLLLLTAPDGFDGMEQVLWGTAIGFLASLATLPALVISIRAVRSDAHSGFATFAAVGNVLVTVQTAIILLATAAYLIHGPIGPLS